MRSENPLLEQGAIEGCSGGILNPTFTTSPTAAQDGFAQLIFRGDSTPGRGTLRRVSLNKDGTSIDDYLGIALSPEMNGTSHDSYSLEDPRAYMHRDPVTNEEGIYLVYVGWNGKQRAELPDSPPDTRNMLAVAYGPNFDRFHRLGQLFHDDMPDKDGSIIDIRPDGSVLAARRPMVGKKWATYIMKAPNLNSEFEVVDIIPPMYEWGSLRNGPSQFHHVKSVGYVGMLHGVKKQDDNYVYSSGGLLLDEQGRLKSISRQPEITPIFADEVKGISGKQVAICTGMGIFGQGNRKHFTFFYGRGDWNFGTVEIAYEAFIRHLQSPENSVDPKVKQSLIQNYYS
ncbi:hypothetical protein GF323_04200 [Candidatus Woesearchaeota archaeon]|nr:hypothetical protein [Candidatus Woesearchaeota archaeon]